MTTCRSLMAWSPWLVRSGVLHLAAVLVEPPPGAAAGVGRCALVQTLAQILRRGADPVGHDPQARLVQPVAVDGVEAQQPTSVLDGGVLEIGPEPLPGVRPRALGMRVVGAPHEGVDAIDVSAPDLLARHG